MPRQELGCVRRMLSEEQDRDGGSSHSGRARDHTADPGMLPVMPGLSRHRKQPEAPGTAPLRAPAPRLALLWERDVKRRPCAAT